jgi:hypothetical protein
LVQGAGCACQVWCRVRVPSAGSEVWCECGCQGAQRRGFERVRCWTIAYQAGCVRTVPLRLHGTLSLLALTRTWHSCLGTRTWHCTLARAPGTRTRHAHLGTTLGTRTWAPHLGTTPGTRTWHPAPSTLAQGTLAPGTLENLLPHRRQRKLGPQLRRRVPQVERRVDLDEIE